MSAFVRRAISSSPSCPPRIRGLYSSSRVRMLSLVSSTRQTDCARVSFAAAASFSALLLAASPTISIRSGISRATFRALSPIDPVAPRMTTRLRFSEVSVVIFQLRHPNHQPQIEEQKRRRKQQTIQKVKRTADSRQQIPRVLYICAALDD